jgi:hypothetical protein
VLALLLTLGLVVGWSLIGLATLTLARADTRDLRVALTAPVLGSAVSLAVLMFLSIAGAPMNPVARPVAGVLLGAALVVVVRRRPRLQKKVLTVVAICLVNLALVGRPALTYGFNWLGNGNADMGFYVDSATLLRTHGLLGPLDLNDALEHSRNYVEATQADHNSGARPGSEVMLASVSKLAGLLPYETFMPLILAFNLCAVCAVGALALQAARRWWAGPLASALFAVSPLAAYGTLQQLLPQTWGLGLASGLFAWLMRKELYRGRPQAADVVVPGFLLIALIASYIELAASLFPAYLLFLAILAVRKELRARSLALVAGGVVGMLVLALNRYLPRELGFVLFRGAAGADLSHHGSLCGAKANHCPPAIFGYVHVPSALPGVLGLQLLPPSQQAIALGASIVVVMVAIPFLVWLVVRNAWRGAGAAIVLLGDVAVGALLIHTSSDFGLYKLFMYAQPFLAATYAVAVTGARRNVLLVAGVLAAAALATVEAPNASVYTQRSMNPVDLRRGSSPTFFPAFRKAFADSTKPFVTVNYNITLGFLERSVTGSKPLYYISDQQAGGGWFPRTFQLHEGKAVARFVENTHVTRFVKTRNCEMEIPAGAQSVVNRFHFPENPDQDLLFRDCSHLPRNTLVFISSNLGQRWYLPPNRKLVALWQLEHDDYYPGHTMSSFGRYALFQVLNPTRKVRLLIDFTTVYAQAQIPSIPRAVVVGKTRVHFRAVGRGSARLISDPVKPQMIGGNAYVLLDMGRNGALIDRPRSGVMALWGRHVPLDPRYLTSWMRDISAISDADYARLRPPAALDAFPQSLHDTQLEYCGISDDGLVGRRSYVVLAGGPKTTLVLRTTVFPVQDTQHLTVAVNGRNVYSAEIQPGTQQLGVPLPASKEKRRISLVWSAQSMLFLHEHRIVSARLLFLGLESSKALKPLTAYPANLRQRNRNYAGIYRDGWMMPDAYFVIPGGKASDIALRIAVPGLSSQHMTARLNGRTVESESVSPGPLELRLRLPSSKEPRRIDLHWTQSTRLPAPDSRLVAARLARITFAAPSAPATLVLPRDLGVAGSKTSGVGADGWAARTATVALAGGPAANLRIVGRVPQLAGQRLRVLVGGAEVASRPLAPGPFDLTLPIPAVTGDRTVELRFAKAGAQGAALLARLAVSRAAVAPLSVRPADLHMPGLQTAGVYPDGWLAQDSRVVLAGGGAADLTIRAQVPYAQNQRLQVLVNGAPLASRPVPGGDLAWTIPLPESRGDRRVELRFAATVPLQAPDTRHASALLRLLALKPRG